VLPAVAARTRARERQPQRGGAVPELSWPLGPWQEAPRQAVVVPISAPGRAPLGPVHRGAESLSPVRRRVPELRRAVCGPGVGRARQCATPTRTSASGRAALAELDRPRLRSSATSVTSFEHRSRSCSARRGRHRDGATARRSDLETVHRNQLRLLKLVNTLLDFSGSRRAASTPGMSPSISPAHLGSGQHLSRRRGSARASTSTCRWSPPRAHVR
jgi:hypothetical protein